MKIVVKDRAVRMRVGALPPMTAFQRVNRAGVLLTTVPCPGVDDVLQRISNVWPHHGFMLALDTESGLLVRLSKDEVVFVVSDEDCELVTGDE